MTRIILILLFMGYLPLTAQSPFKPNQWAFFLEAGGNYFQWGGFTLELLAWDQWILDYYKLNPHPPVSGF